MLDSTIADDRATDDLHLDAARAAAEVAVAIASQDYVRAEAHAADLRDRLDTLAQRQRTRADLSVLLARC